VRHQRFQAVNKIRLIELEKYHVQELAKYQDQDIAQVIVIHGYGS
jgi:hypothetical protein